MTVSKTFLQHTDDIERYLRDNEHPSDLVRLCKTLNQKDAIQKLSESPIFYYRFINKDRELWNISKEPFYNFFVDQAWEEDTPYPSPSEVQAWLTKL